MVSDGIKLIERNKDFAKLKQESGIRFLNNIDEESGESVGRRQKDSENISYKYCGTWNHYRTTVYETWHIEGGDVKDIKHTMLIDGSIHKSYFDGSNLERLTFDNSVKEINKLANKLLLDSHNTDVQNNESGVNFEIEKHKLGGLGMNEYIQKCLILHSTKPFVDYDPDENGFILGRHTNSYSQKEIKFYDKGGQNGLVDREVGRFEVAVNVMQYLNENLKTLKEKELGRKLTFDDKDDYTIRRLGDLLDRERIERLSGILLKEFDEILIAEPDVNPSNINLTLKGKRLTEIQREILKGGQNRDHWVRLHKENRSKFNKHRVLFNQIQDENSVLKTKSYLRQLILSECYQIMNDVETEQKKDTKLACAAMTFAIGKIGTKLACSPSVFRIMNVKRTCSHIRY